MIRKKTEIVGGIEEQVWSLSKLIAKAELVCYKKAENIGRWQVYLREKSVLGEEIKEEFFAVYPMKNDKAAIILGEAEDLQAISSDLETIAEKMIETCSVQKRFLGEQKTRGLSGFLYGAAAGGIAALYLLFDYINNYSESITAKVFGSSRQMLDQIPGVITEAGIASALIAGLLGYLIAKKIGGDADREMTDGLPDRMLNCTFGEQASRIIDSKYEAVRKLHAAYQTSGGGIGLLGAAALVAGGAVIGDSLDEGGSLDEGDSFDGFDGN